MKNVFNGSNIPKTGRRKNRAACFYAAFWMILAVFSLFNRILRNKSQKSIKILCNLASSFKKHQKSAVLLAIRMELWKNNCAICIKLKTFSYAND
jgi:hypothetical protein